MLFGMSWWASVFVLWGLAMLKLELRLVFSEDDTDEPDTLGAILTFTARMLFNVALILSAILFFQDKENVIFQVIAMLVAGYVVVAGVYLVGLHLVEFFSGVFGKEPDVLSEVIGLAIYFSYWGCGILLAYYGLMPFLFVM